MKKLLTEFYELCKDGICQDLLTEREKHEVANGGMYLSGRIQTCEKKNGNGRIYPCNVLKREIQKYEPGRRGLQNGIRERHKRAHRRSHR